MVWGKGKPITRVKGKHEEKATSMDSVMTVWYFMIVDQNIPLII